eukprot:TRINITY_DN27683_c0_g1_i3.p1 TRINITY_DN27683_c0_g1~~TRINITY_DN27683_c0_g1_i3.p1  ORF type:complete len:2142 (-),score=506.42 TRINITY_DN27683_c0_g1_i3:50-6475(-)
MVVASPPVAPDTDCGLAKQQPPESPGEPWYVAVAKIRTSGSDSTASDKKVMSVKARRAQLRAAVVEEPRRSTGSIRSACGSQRSIRTCYAAKTRDAWNGTPGLKSKGPPEEKRTACPRRSSQEDGKDAKVQRQQEATAAKLLAEGDAAFEAGHHELAFEYFGKAIALQHAELGNNHAECAGTLTRMGNAVRAMGDAVMAIDFYQRAVAVMAATSSARSPSVASALCDVGGAFESLQRWDDAIQYYTEAVAIFRESVGDNHPDVGAVYNNIGLAQEAAGRLALAFENFSQALMVRRFALGEEHPDVADTYSNMAVCYLQSRKYELSRKFQALALSIRINKLGQDHESVAASYNNMAIAYEKSGENELAVEFYERALVIRRKFAATTGLMTPMADTLYNLAGVHLAMGSRVKARAHFEEAYRIYRERHGPLHVTTTRLKTILAELYKPSGNPVKSKGLKSVIGDHLPHARNRGNDEGESRRLNSILLVEDKDPTSPKAGKQYKSWPSSPGSSKATSRASSPSRSMSPRRRVGTISPDRRFGDLMSEGSSASESRSRSPERRGRSHGPEHPESDGNVRSKRALESSASTFADLGEAYMAADKLKLAQEYYKMALKCRLREVGKKPDAQVAHHYFGLGKTYMFMAQKPSLGHLESESFYKISSRYFLRSADTLRKARAVGRVRIASAFHYAAKCCLGIARGCNDPGKAQPHFVKANDLCSCALEICLATYGPEHQAVGDIFCDMGECYTALHKYDKALEGYTMALRIREVLGENHPEFMVTRKNMAKVYTLQNQFTVALELAEKTLEMRLQKNGEMDALTADMMTFLADIHIAHGQHEDLIHNFAGKPSYEEALKLYERARHIQTELHGGHHLDATKSQLGEARAYELLKNFPAASEMYRLVLNARRMELGEEDTDVANVYHKLGCLHNQQHNYDEALYCFNKALAIKRRNHCDEIDMASTHSEIAVLQLTKGDYRDAIVAATKALAIISDRLGVRHPHVAVQYRLLAKAYDVQTKFSFARPFYNKCLEIEVDVHGENHAEVAMSCGNVARMFWYEGRFEGAAKMYNRAIDSGKASFGDDNPSVARYICEVGSVSCDCGSYSVARGYYTSAAKMFSTCWSEEHPETLDSKRRAAYTYLKEGLLNEALEQYAELFETGEDLRPEGSLESAITLDHIADICTALCHYTGAFAMYMEAKQRMSFILGAGHPDVGDICRRAAHCRLLSDTVDDTAFELLTEALNAYKAYYGPVHALVADVHDQIGNLHAHGINHECASDEYEEALQIRKKLYGENDTRLAGSMQLLARSSKALRRLPLALRYYSRAAKLTMSSVDKKGADVARMLNEMAECFMQTGALSKAFHPYKQALDICNEVCELDDELVEDLNRRLGDVCMGLEKDVMASQHYNLAVASAELSRDPDRMYKAWRKLADVDFQKGDYENAAKFYEKAQGLLEAKLGADHPDVLEGTSNMANAYSKLGQHDNALNLHFKAVEVYRMTFGEKAIETSDVMHRLADAFLLAEDYEKAVTYYEQVLQIRLQVYGEGHVDTADTYKAVAIAERHLGKFDKSARFLAKALQIKTQLFSRENPDVGFLHAELAETMMAQGDHAKGVDMYVQALVIVKSDLGKRTCPERKALVDKVCEACERKAMYELYMGDMTSAARTYERLLDIRIKEDGNRSDLLFDIHRKIGSVYSVAGDAEMASKSYGHAVRCAQDNSPQRGLLLVYHSMAMHYMLWEDYDLASHFHRKVLNLQRIVLGWRHIDICVTVRLVALTDQFLISNRLGDEAAAKMIYHLAQMFRSCEAYAGALDLYNKARILLPDSEISQNGATGEAPESAQEPGLAAAATWAMEGVHLLMQTTPTKGSLASATQNFINAKNNLEAAYGEKDALYLEEVAWLEQLEEMKQDAIAEKSTSGLRVLPDTAIRMCEDAGVKLDNLNRLADRRLFMIGVNVSVLANFIKNARKAAKTQEQDEGERSKSKSKPADGHQELDDEEPYLPAACRKLVMYRLTAAAHEVFKADYKAMQDELVAGNHGLSKFTREDFLAAWRSTLRIAPEEIPDVHISALFNDLQPDASQRLAAETFLKAVGFTPVEVPNDDDGEEHEHATRQKAEKKRGEEKRSKADPAAAAFKKLRSVCCNAQMLNAGT